MIVECYRGAGDRPAGDLIEAPMLSDAMLIERGRAEMDASAHQFNAVNLDIVPRPGVRLGQLVQAVDPMSAQPLRGKVTGLKISVVAGTDTAGPTFDHVLTLEVPA